MKNPHMKQTKVNLLTPVDPKSIVTEEQSDCFGQEYNPRDRDCSICSDIQLCGLVYAEKTKDKKVAFEIQHGPLMDITDFKGVDIVRIEKLVKKYEEEQEPMTFEELQKLIQDQAATKDVEAIIQFIKRTIPISNLIIREGHIYVRQNNNNKG